MGRILALSASLAAEQPLRVRAAALAQMGLTAAARRTADAATFATQRQEVRALMAAVAEAATLDRAVVSAALTDADPAGVLHRLVLG